MVDFELARVLVHKYGPTCYALKVMKEVGEMKAKVKLKKVSGEEAKPAKVKPVPAKAAKVKAPAGNGVCFDGVDLHGFGKRWQKGESIAALATEVKVCSWNRLHSELSQLGYHKGN
jgi:hypothetical protein